MHGFAIASDLGRGFTSNGRANSSTIVDLKTRFETVARDELKKALLTIPENAERERKALELLAHNIVGKLLHEPMTMLKKCSENGDAEVARVCRTLFRLEADADNVDENGVEENGDVEGED